MTIGNDGAGAFAVAMQPDEKIVAFGDSDYAPGVSGFTVVRYLDNGSLDPSFGNGGIVVTPIGTVVDIAWAGLVQPDDKIVAAGQTTVGSDNDFAVARYLPNGSLDPSFGNGGRVTLPLPQGLSGYAESAVLRPDGKIVLGGLAQDPSGPTRAAVIACLNADGTLDTSFGNAGFTVMPIEAFESVHSLAAQPDNKVLAVLRVGGGQAISVARLTPDGALDSSFGTNGIATAPFPSLVQAWHTEQVTLLPNGDILVGADHGFGAPAPGEFALAQFTTNGTLDTSALSNGTALVAPTAAADSMAVLTGLQPQADGRIVLTGVVGAFDAQRIEIDRVLPSGAYDPAFDCTGQVAQTAPDGERWRPWGAAIDRDGRLVIAGERVYGGPTDQDLIVERYLLTNTPACKPSTNGGGGTTTTTTTPTTTTPPTTTRTKPRTAAAKPATTHAITGTKAANHLTGTAGPDVIHGEAGNDHINGRGGNDTLWGDAGNDTLTGGLGNDHIYGGPGNDTIYARDGQRDVINCGAGHDTVYADKTDNISKNCERVHRH